MLAQGGMRNGIPHIFRLYDVLGSQPVQLLDQLNFLRYLELMRLVQFVLYPT